MITQFLGAFNDNIYRSALIMLITYRFADEMGVSAGILNNIALAAFIAPYFFFSALAGQLADKFEKRRQIVWIKVWEIILMLAGAIGFMTQSVPLLILVLSGLGLQSTFFGPIKYAILPDLVKKEELLGANALIEATTFVAVLLGTITGSLVALTAHGLEAVIAVTVGVAVCGTVAGYFVPKTERAAPDLYIRRNIAASTSAILRTTMSNAVMRPAIISISWMWALGAILLTQIPVIAKDILGGTEGVVTLFLACFSLGVGAGSMMANRWLKGVISARLAGPSILALALICALLFFFLESQGPIGAATVTLGMFLQDPLHWAVLLLMITLALAVGIVMVPFYAILQHTADPSARSRVIASNNIINSVFIASSSVIAAALIGFAGLSASQVVLVAGLANLIFVPSAMKVHKRMKAVHPQPALEAKG